MKNQQYLSVNTRNKQILRRKVLQKQKNSA